jgi:RNA polymerase sigma factor (sigma-70 family)
VKTPCSLPSLHIGEEVSMKVTDEDLKAFPPPEHLIELVRDVVGLGNEARQREAQNNLAIRFHSPFLRLIRKRHRHFAYEHIGGFHEGKDDLQRLYMYIIFGCREDSKGRLSENKPPLLTWLENMEDPKKARNIKQYVICVANKYLKDLHRNVIRGRGKERPVTWDDETENNDGDQAGAHAEKERQIQFRARQLADLETLNEDKIRDGVRKCLDLMPQEEREALLVRFHEGGTQAQYAMEVGVSEATVSRRVKNGKQKFEQLLDCICPGLLQRHEVGQSLRQKLPKERS